MEISPLMIYVIGFVDKLEIFFESVLWLGFVAGPILLIGSIPDDDSPNVDRKKIASWFKCVFATMIISAICLVTIPTSKTLIAMYVIPPIANSQVVHEIPDVLLDFVKSYVSNMKDDDV